MLVSNRFILPDFNLPRFVCEDKYRGKQVLVQAHHAKLNVFGTDYSPTIITAIIRGGQQRPMQLLSERDYIEQARQSGFYTLPRRDQNMRKAFLLGKMPPSPFGQLTVEDLLRGHSFIAACNAGNAPLQEWDVNYIHGDKNPVQSKDAEIMLYGKEPIYHREYPGLITGAFGTTINNLFFEANLTPCPSSIKFAVSGKPLLWESKRVTLETLFPFFFTEPRQLFRLPEIDSQTIGIQQFQRAIDSSHYPELLSAICRGEAVDFNLEAEAGYLGTTEAEVIKAFERYGYQPGREKDFMVDGKKLHARLRMGYYRHTFIASLFNGDIMLGMIKNDLDPVYPQKALGLSVPHLFGFLESQKAVNAILLGGGKDCRIIVNQGEEGLVAYQDDARALVHAGMIVFPE